MNKTVHTYASIGREIADAGWGKVFDGSLTDCIKGLNQDTLTTCVLTAMYERITMLQATIHQAAGNARQQQIDSQRSAQAKPSHPAADAMLFVLASPVAAIRIEPDGTFIREHFGSLSARARKTIYRLASGGRGYLNGITARDLCEVQNCGITTANEILEFIQKYKPVFPSG